MGSCIGFFIVMACSDTGCFERSVHRQRVLCSHAFVVEAYLPCTVDVKAVLVLHTYLRGRPSATAATAAAPCAVCQRHYGRAALRLLAAHARAAYECTYICCGACTCRCPQRACVLWLCPTVCTFTCTLSHLHCVCVGGVAGSAVQWECSALIGDRLSECSAGCASVHALVVICGTPACMQHASTSTS